MNTCTVTTVHNAYTHLQFTLQFWFGVKYQKQRYPSYLFPCTKETLYPISALAYTLTPYNITACCWHNIIYVQWCFTKESTILTRNNQCSHKVYTVTMTTCIGSCITGDMMICTCKYDNSQHYNSLIALLVISHKVGSQYDTSTSIVSQMSEWHWSWLKFNSSVASPALASIQLIISMPRLLFSEIEFD